VGSEKDRDEERAGNWRQVLAGGGLLAVVGTVLVIGAVLETPVAPARVAAQRSAAPSEALGEPRTAAEARDGGGSWQPAQSPATMIHEDSSAPSSGAGAAGDEPVLDPIARRTLEDPMRLRKSAGRYTAQVAFVCKRESAERLLERAGGAPDVFVLPEAREGQDCFRFCWGTFASREEALAAAGLPAALRDGLGKPDAKRIAELLP
jgi:septal ring-binding cell division protein DamX